jgi:Selenocysteine lyase
VSTYPTPSAELGLSLTSARARFPALDSRAYLYWGGLAPASAPVREAMTQWLETWEKDPIEHRSRYTFDLEACRELLARLVRVSSDDIAILDNTSRAANLAVAIVGANPGQNVVVDATTYDSCIYPWLLSSRRGIEVRMADSGSGPLEAIEAVVDDATAAVSVSHVSHKSGFRHDLPSLAAIAHAHHALLLVDVAQSAGVTPVDVRGAGVDIAYGVSMKWLCGPPGLGYLYLTPELMASREPPHVGHAGTSFGPDGSLAFKPGGRRYDIGVANLPGLAGFRAGLELVLAAGIERIADQTRRLTARVVDGLRSRDIETLTPESADQRAGIVAALVGDPIGLRAFLRDQSVDVWTWERDGRLRVDCHGFNTDDDIDRLLDALDAFRALGGRLTRQKHK